MTTYQFYRSDSLIGHALVEHNTVMASSLPLQGKDWEDCRAMLQMLGVEIRPLVDEDEDLHPTEIQYRGMTYRFKWDGDTLVRCSLVDQHGFVQDVRAADLPLAVRRTL